MDTQFNESVMNFIASDAKYGTLFFANGRGDACVRKSTRIHDGVGYRTFEIVRVYVEEEVQGQGIFSAFIRSLLENPQLHDFSIYVEYVLGGSSRGDYKLADYFRAHSEWVEFEIEGNSVPSFICLRPKSRLDRVHSQHG